MQNMIRFNITIEDHRRLEAELAMAGGRIAGLESQLKNLGNQVGEVQVQQRRILQEQVKQSKIL